jgi:hypothetical protein
VARPFAPAPHGTALLDCARRNPSKIPSQAQSVFAFLPGKVSMGAPFLRRIALQAMPLPRKKFAATRKIRRGQAAYKPSPLRFALFSVLLPDGALKVIDVWWEQNVAFSFPAGSTHGD